MKLCTNLKNKTLSLLLMLAGGTATADELIPLRTGFGQAMAERDSEKVAQFFDEQGILVKQDGSTAQGHTAISKGFRDILADKEIRIISVPGSSTTIKNGDIILRTGRWQKVDESGKVREEWFASEVFRKNPKGEWVYLIDHPYNKLP